jgi:23S rRNA pseudouridine1911/1915/1917 synthase
MQEWVVADVDAGMRLDLWLARRTDAGSRGRAAEWLERGKVYLDGQPVDLSKAAHRIAEGERIGVWMARPGSSKPADRTVRTRRHLLSIVHADPAIVVVDKPAGLLVEPLPGPTGGEATLLDLLDDHFRHETRSTVYVVHRIDRDTSGLVLFARAPAALEALKEQFERHEPERVYLAVLLGSVTPDRDTWRDELAWDARSLRQRRAHGRDARGKEAVAKYCVREHFNAATFVEVTLVTGKRNQIRVQAGLRGHPLVGERQYRFDAPPEQPGTPTLGRQALHAWRLGFVHPVSGRTLSFTAPIPADFKALLGALRKTQPEAVVSSPPRPVRHPRARGGPGSGFPPS